MVCPITQGDHNDESAQLSHDELLPPRRETASHSESENNTNVDNTTRFEACDVGNFDLQFDFNDTDSDVNKLHIFARYVCQPVGYMLMNDCFVVGKEQRRCSQNI